LEVSLGLGGEPEKEYSAVGENLGCNKIEMVLGRREQERKEWRQRKEV